MEKLYIFVILYQDNILIYTDNQRNGQVTAIWLVLEQLREFL